MPDIPNRTALESRFEKLLKRSFGKSRDRLLAAIGDPPDVANVPASLWDSIEQDINDDTRRILSLIFLLGSDGMVTQFSHEPDAEEMGKIAAKYAQGRSAVIAKSMVGTLRDRVGTAAAGGTLNGSRLLDIITNQASNAAITETTAANSAGEGGFSQIFKRDTGTTIVAVWRTAADAKVCKICAPLNQTEEAVWSKTISDGPPAHGSCRCWLEWRTVKTQG